MDIEKKINYWASSNDFDEQTRQEIQKLILAKNIKELTDRFSQDLEFGTGGLRGIIAAGTNRMNFYTIRKVTQALAEYLNQKFLNPLVAISYDNRHCSEQFAKESACVLAANGVSVWIFSELTPTPILSFAVRYFQANAGIMITASHNPPNYNGYKVFQSDGSQIIFPADQEISEKISKITKYSQVKTGNWMGFFQQKKICFIPPQLLQDYYQLVNKNCLNSKIQNNHFGVIYTPLHGTGKVPILALMKQRGFRQFRMLKSQQDPDPNFSTLQSPNPENISAMELALQSARDSEELILATDPDADRLGVMVRQQKDWVFLHGNQIGALMLYYKLKSLEKNNTLVQNGAFVTTIVSSHLLQKIAKSFDIMTYETLTGFKNIAQVMSLIEKKTKQKFLFGCEESNGYLLSDEVRDKDGIMSVVFFAELAAAQKEKGVMGLMAEIYQKYGNHYDSLLAFTFQGLEGKEKIQKIMRQLRANANSIFSREKISYIKDYQDPKTVQQMKEKNLFFESSNVLSCYLEDEGRITARPSGTEPKIKFYINLFENERNGQVFLKQKAQKLENIIKKFVNSL